MALPEIYVFNKSAHVSADELVKTIAAQQRDLAQNFQPIWNEYALLKVVNDGDAVPAAGPLVWYATLQDGGADPGVLAFHQDSKWPSIIVDVAACMTDGASWQSALNHEIKEALVDAICNICAETAGKLYAFEVCDMVEGKPYQVDGVDCECFCTPNWFVDGSDGPWDFSGPGVAPQLSAPLTLAAGGYVMFKDDSGEWAQITGARARTAKHVAAPESRRARRMLNSGDDPSKLALVAA
jgi:hypothetical protein